MRSFSSPRPITTPVAANPLADCGWAVPWEGNCHFADCPPCDANAAAAGQCDEVLARDTHEARLVVRVGEWVLKFLRPTDDYAAATGTPPAAWVRELRLRVAESRRHAELNPLWFHEPRHVLASPFVPGRMATREEADALLDHFAHTGRGYIKDVTPANVRFRGSRPIVIDFLVVEYNRDWRARVATLPRGSFDRCPSRAAEPRNGIHRC